MLVSSTLKSVSRRSMAGTALFNKASTPASVSNSPVKSVTPLVHPPPPPRSAVDPLPFVRWAWRVCRCPCRGLRPGDEKGYVALTVTGHSLDAASPCSLVYGQLPIEHQRSFMRPISVVKVPSHPQFFQRKGVGSSPVTSYQYGFSNFERCVSSGNRPSRSRCQITPFCPPLLPEINVIKVVL